MMECGRLDTSMFVDWTPASMPRATEYSTRNGGNPHTHLMISTSFRTTDRDLAYFPNFRTRVVERSRVDVGQSAQALGDRRALAAAHVLLRCVADRLIIPRRRL